MAKYFLPSIIFVLTCFSFLARPLPIFAKGVSLSTTALGATATWTSQIAANPCKDNQSRQITGFGLTALPIDEKGTMHSTPVVIDLSQVQISQLTIGSQTVTNFQKSNARSQYGSQVVYDLTSPVTFDSNDGASIVASNVKLVLNGRAETNFALLTANPYDTQCLHSGWSTYTIGTSAPKATPTQQIRRQQPTATPTITVTRPVTLTDGREASAPSPAQVKKNIIQLAFDWLKNLISRF